MHVRQWTGSLCFVCRERVAVKHAVCHRCFSRTWMRRKKGERQASAVSADLAVARAAVKAADVRVERLERELAEASLCLLCRSRPGWRREGSSGLCWRCARGAERAGEEAFWRGFYGPRRPSGAHGSERRYVTGCRCEQCRRAQALRELDELWPVS